MKSDLIERYIYAATKGLPSKTRNDIDSELRTLIEDMLESRCGDIVPTESDIKLVLTQLGTPSELAEKYNPDSSNSLIGPKYYSKYKTILTIVLTATAFGMSLAGIIPTIMDPNAVWYEAIPNWLSMIFMGLLNSFAFVTVLFAVLERKGVAINLGTDNLDNLPPVPHKDAVISRWEPISGIAVSVIFCIVFIIAPQIFTVIIDGRTFIPIFNTELIKSMWYLIIAFTALGIIREGFKFYEGRYTKKLAIITVVTDILTAILSFAFLLDRKIINTGFTSAMNSLFENDTGIIKSFFSSFNVYFLAIILFALTLDMFITSIKAIKYDK